MTNWLSPDEQRMFRQWLAIATRALDTFDARLQARSGLAITDYEILVHLSEAPGRKLRMSELAGSVFISRSRLTYRVDRMVERGLVVREEAHDDKRGLNARLTDEGFDALVAAAPGHVEDVREVLFDRVTPEELPIVSRVLQRMIDGLEESD